MLHDFGSDFFRRPTQALLPDESPSFRYTFHGRYAMFQALRDADMVADMLARYPAVTAWMMRVEEHTGTRAARGD